MYNIILVCQAEAGSEYPLRDLTERTFSERDLQTQLFLTRNISTHKLKSPLTTTNGILLTRLLSCLVLDWHWLIPPLRTLRASQQSAPCFSGPFWRSFLSSYELLLASLHWAGLEQPLPPIYTSPPRNPQSLRLCPSSLPLLSREAKHIFKMVSCKQSVLHPQSVSVQFRDQIKITGNFLPMCNSKFLWRQKILENYVLKCF